MRKVLVLTLAMVLALGSLAFAAEVGGELKSVVEYNVVDEETGKNYKGVARDTTKLTVTAAEDGVFDASVTVAAGDAAIELDGYEFHLYDELFTVDAWGAGTELDAYKTALGFVEAPADAEHTVRFTSAVFGPELVADFSKNDKNNIRLFGKYDLNGITIGGATNWAEGKERDYAVFATADLYGVTLSGEFMLNSMRDDNNKKYGVKADTTVADFALTAKVVRDTNDTNEGNHSTQLYGKVAYDVETVPYGFSLEVDNRTFEADDLKGTKVVLSGDYEVVPEFLTVNAGYTRISQEGRKDDGNGDSPFTVKDVKNWKGSDIDFLAFDKYNKFELGATINVTSKLTIEPSYTYQKFEDVAVVNDEKGNRKDLDKKDEVVYSDLAIDATYAITDATSVTYGLTKRINERNDGKYEGLFHTLGVSVKF